jgi:branched-chain amino acid transport system permease protein
MKHPFGPLILILASIFLLPLVVRPALASEIWIFAIFGLGLNLLLGYTGLLSFGQSTFFGSAAYVAGWLLKYYGINVFLALGVGVAVGALSAAVVGYLCVQRSGLYFIMLTFALNQLFYFVAYQWTSVTGGEDGMPGVPRPEFLGLDFRNPLLYYAFVSVLFLVSLFSMKKIVESPLGRILVAIRENEARAGAVGYDVPRFKLLAFVIGGAFSGAAGVLYAMLFGIVPLEAISFVASGNVVFATLIGGSGSLYGPVIGAFVFIWLSESVSTLWARWPLLLGVAFVIVVLFLRGGVVEAWHRLFFKFSKK